MLHLYLHRYNKYLAKCVVIHKRFEYRIAYDNDGMFERGNEYTPSILNKQERYSKTSLTRGIELDVHFPTTLSSRL